MTAKQKIVMALAYAELTQAELARRLGMQPQLLNQRMATGRFTIDEWEKIAEAIGAKLDIAFVFEKGVRV